MDSWVLEVPVILAVPVLSNFLQFTSLYSSVSYSYTNSQYDIEKPLDCKVGKKYRRVITFSFTAYLPNP
jgi:hypothetical protein